MRTKIRTHSAIVRANGARGSRRERGFVRWPAANSHPACGRVLSAAGDIERQAHSHQMSASALLSLDDLDVERLRLSSSFGRSNRVLVSLLVSVLAHAVVFHIFMNLDAVQSSPEFVNVVELAIETNAEGNVSAATEQTATEKPQSQPIRSDAVSSSSSPSTFPSPPNARTSIKSVNKTSSAREARPAPTPPPLTVSEPQLSEVESPSEISRIPTQESAAAQISSSVALSTAYSVDSSAASNQAQAATSGVSSPSMSQAEASAGGREGSSYHDLPLNLSPSFRERPQPPVYPRRSVELGQEGTVLVRALIDTDGAPAELEIWKTSGFAMLDNAALTAVRRWRFQPARSGARIIRSWVQVPVHFKLN